jgi:hypothetical protein
VVDAVAGLGTITAISAASGCVPTLLSLTKTNNQFSDLFGTAGPNRIPEHRQSVVLFESGRVLGFGEFKGELKKESWLVPRSVCAGAGGVFLLC